MIHVCYGLHDKDGLYSKFTGTAMLSIFANTKEKVTVHILHDTTLTETNRENFQAIADQFNQLVEFHNVEILYPAKLELLREKLSEHIGKRFSIGAFYRLLIKEIRFRDVSKVIYLDSDTIVNLDIQELWDYPLEDYPIAATPELEATRNHMITEKFLLHTNQVRLEDYFCSGVVVINLDKFDKNFFDEGVAWLAENPKCECVDQDILNRFFSTNYARLPEKFDSFVGVCRNLDENTLQPKIYHYAGRVLGMNMNDAFDKIFFTHFVKTRWFNLEMLGRICDGVDNVVRLERSGIFIRLSALMSGKARAFFTFNMFADLVRRVFQVSKNEEVLLINPGESIKPLLKSMKKSGGKKIFFLVVDDYDGVNAALQQAGFSEFKDFLNAMQYLPTSKDNPINSYQLVKML